MLTLYTHPMSPCAQKVRIVLAEKGLSCEQKHVSLPDKENLRPEYLKLNPLGVVPTLVHNDQPVIESSIICEYLDDAFPEVPLMSPDPMSRSRARLWMKHVDTKLHPACGALQWPLVMRPALMDKPEEEWMAILSKVPEKPRRERQIRLMKYGLEAPDVADASRMYHKTIKDMEEALDNHQWVGGSEFGLADICLSPYFQTLYQFGWSEMYEKGFPRVTDWYFRCRDRLSYKEAVTDDFSEELLDKLKTIGKPGWEIIQSHLKEQ